MVNDGDGGFRPMQSIEEALAYGDARLARMVKTPKAGSPKPDAATRDKREGTGERIGDTIVGHLPLGMCEPDGTYFNPRDPKTGRGKMYAKGSKAGEPIMLPRYRAKDMGEAVRYFEAFVSFQAQLLPGGQESIHCYSLQFDEGRPHVQILADLFEPDVSKKNPQGLKSGYQRAFGSHRSDMLVQSTDRKTGTPLFNADGSPKMVREGGSRKMSRYHEELREHMLALGYDIESEIDLDRHMRRLDHADYQQLLDAQAEHEDRVAEDLAFVGATMREAEDHREMAVDVLVDAHESAEATMVELSHAEVAAIARTAELDQRESALDQRESALDQREAEIPQLRAAAVDEGRAEGRAEGRRLAEQARADGYRDGHAAGVRDAESETSAMVEQARADRAAAAEAVREAADLTPAQAAQRVVDDYTTKSRDALKRYPVIKVGYDKTGKPHRVLDAKGKPVVTNAWEQMRTDTAHAPGPDITVGQVRRDGAKLTREIAADSRAHDGAQQQSQQKRNDRGIGL
ncbi:hypothetical protein [Gordonia sp. 852002-10350_SCH5691597]|uniref:hypothetical protein n=1 Tax=Gordonia sp. 852002-10350_SCH5691597 TaxID=1834085 RepID=UPI0012E9910D|nr:hypothetical protein [Gordonia sp. 852002-10350_SCH5691597]